MKFLRDPLVIFLLIGGGIFALYSAAAPEEPSNADHPDRIEITPEIQAVLEDEWSARWNRPPTEAEFKGLLDSYIKEEILFREALKLGLDQSDSIIRRRLAQKMEFLTSDIADLEEVSDDNLEAYFQKQADDYRVDPEVGFQHIFFSPEKRADAPGDASALLAQLKAGTLNDEEAVEQSDRTLLSPDFATTSIPIIGRQFGEDFAGSLMDKELGEWFGPIASNYGIHLVKVLERIDGGVPSLETIRETVYNDYRYDKRSQLNDAMLEDLLERYEVVIADRTETTDSP